MKMIACAVVLLALSTAALAAEPVVPAADQTALLASSDPHLAANKKLVFSSKEVLQTFANKKIALLKADWTNRDPQITAELAKYERSAVPFDLVWLPGRNDPVILPELLTPGTVLKAVNSKG